MTTIISRIKELMESIVPNSIEAIANEAPLNESFDLASKEYLAWLLENEFNISISEVDVEKWESLQDICASVLPQIDNQKNSMPKQNAL